MSGTNREKSIAATKAKYWCGCDRKLIGQYGKCKVCGSRDIKKLKIPKLDIKHELDEMAQKNP